MVVSSLLCSCFNVLLILKGLAGGEKEGKWWLKRVVALLYVLHVREK